MGTFFIGLMGLFNKLALNTGINPTVYLAIRLTIVTFILGAAVLIKKKKIDQLTNPENWRIIALLAIIGVVVTKLLSMWGLSMIDLSAKTLLASMQILFVIIISYFVLKERLPKKFFIFAVGILVGIVLIVWPLENFILNIGYVLVIFSSLGYAITHVLVAKWRKNISALNLNFGRVALGSVILLAIMFVTAFEEIPTVINGWQYLICASITGAVGGTFALKGIQKEGASMQQSVNSIKRLWAVVLSVIFLGDVLTPTIIIGGIVILVCAYFISKKKIAFNGEGI